MLNRFEKDGMPEKPELTPEAKEGRYTFAMYLYYNKGICFKKAQSPEYHMVAYDFLKEEYLKFCSTNNYSADCVGWYYDGCLKELFTGTQEKGIEPRKLKDLRDYVNRLTVQDRLVPESRAVRQVLDLQLLKAAIKKQDMYVPNIEWSIDICIEGFIWLYVNGGTHDSLPDIINEDVEAKAYYVRFTKNWSELQEYMRTHMHLMEV